MVYSKLKEYYEKLKNNEYALQMIEVAYDYSCNLRCEHCFVSKLGQGDRRLKIEDLKELTQQADELGIFQYNLQGGEPLIWRGLDEVILALNPERFHITLTINGLLLDYNMAEHLKSLGVDKISVSLDSFDENLHDHNRNMLFETLLKNLLIKKI